MEIAALVDALHESAAATPGVTSLVVFGSTTRASAGRRDEWSDVDFNLFVDPPAAGRLAFTWEFLPFRDRLVLTAHEGGDGGVALYDDGTFMEFGAGLPWVIRDPDREVLLDGGDLTFAPPPPLPAPADQVGLFLVKLMIGVGRVRRGERISGNGHVRTYALTALCEALRQHLAPDAPRSPFDPLRRLEQALPALGARLGELLDQDVETCARGLFELAHESLAGLVPAAAWDVVAARMGWDLVVRRD